MSDRPAGRPFTVARLAEAMQGSGTARLDCCPPAEVLLEGWLDVGVVVQVGDGSYRATEHGLRLARIAAFLDGD